MDVESLQKSGRRRSGCLDAFVIASITFLFVAVAAVAVVGTMAVMELRSKLDSPTQFKQVGTLHPTGDSPSSGYKMQNFVYLQAASGKVTNFTMPWARVDYGAGDSVGSNFVFDSDQHSLKPRKAGSYFIYIDLNLTCTFRCKAGLLRVMVGDKLTCEVELPEKADEIPVSKKCWTVSLVQDQGLVTKMTVPEGLQNWRLEMNSSGLGMFHVD
ncbi:uncharacterized protein LOC119017562 [Acanthopagrus latus]|uniref:uncharacterized protein LOC119017562 n=1 Tax=Acanthopagrus latus TaxID=8177 RepID=UPI00187D068C|nr:uncharacterized protein LOC119017562 [Acanthopagrus latus]